jgi:transposase-like protein
MAIFTAQQKIQAVQRYLEGTEGQESIAKSIGVTSGVLITWIRLYQYHR